MTWHKKYSLSDLIVVGDAQRHSQAHEIEQQIEDLCACFGIMLPHFAEYNSMTTCVLPHTPVERLVPIGVLNNLLYYLNDMYDRHTRTSADMAMQAKLRQVFQTGIHTLVTGTIPDEDHFFYDVLLYLHQEFQQQAQGAWILRLARSLIHHLNATTYSISSVIINDKVDVGHYIAVRELDSRLNPMLDMLEFAGGYYLPADILNERHLRYMRGLCTKIGALMNDLFSYEKEVLQRGSRFNLLVAYMDSYGMTFDEAVHHSIEMLNVWSISFLDTLADMPDYADPLLNARVNAYTQGMKDILGATWHWQMHSERYRSSTSPFNELKPRLSA
ncbi:MAG: terpene synthase family protein [Aggregatilineales bacterium]